MTGNDTITDNSWEDSTIFGDGGADTINRAR